MDRKRQYMILWRKLDRSGHEACAAHFRDPFWHVTGSAVFLDGRQPCLLNYHVVCDAGWATVSATVTGRLGARAIDVRLRVDAGHHWNFNGAPCQQVSGCIDVDLNFSPSTNVLPIQRLNLPVGGKAEVTTAWLRFPDFTLEPAVQVYGRTGNTGYRFESGGYSAELRVNSDGFVTQYPGLWQSEGYLSAAKMREMEDAAVL